MEGEALYLEKREQEDSRAAQGDGPLQAHAAARAAPRDGHEQGNRSRERRTLGNDSLESRRSTGGCSLCSSCSARCPPGASAAVLKGDSFQGKPAQGTRWKHRSINTSRWPREAGQARKQLLGEEQLSHTLSGQRVLLRPARADKQLGCRSQAPSSTHTAPTLSSLRHQQSAADRKNSSFGM